MRRGFLSMWKVEFARFFLPAILSGASFGIFLHGYRLIDFFPIDSKSLLFSTLLAGLIGMIGYILLFHWVEKAIIDLSCLQKAGLAGISLLMGAFLFFTATTQWQKNARYFSLFLPKHTLEISIPARAGADAVSISWVTTSLGDVSYTAIDYEGWSLEKDRLVLTNPSNNHLRWVGKTGEKVQIVFETPMQDGNAVISWDGQGETLQFPRKKNTYEHTFEIPFYASQGWILLLGILNCALLSLPLCILGWQMRVEMLQSIQRSFSLTPRQVAQYEWAIIFALMILAFALRLPGLGNLFPSVEEYSHINAAKQITQGASIHDVYQRSMWLVTLPVSFMFRVFGYELSAARLLGVVFNVLAVIPLYLVARRINRPIAVLSVVLFATSPWVIAISRVVREYAYHPFYFFWIVYGMILLLDEIPRGFRIDRDWKIILQPKRFLLLPGLALPPLYALLADPLSTFKLILIAYAVLGLFLLLKVDFRHRKNLPVILLMAGAALVSAYFWHERFSMHLTVNLAPLDYFFLNSAQQWYFDRASIIPLVGLFGAMIFAFLTWRTNLVPAFLLILYAGFLGFFVFSSNRFFAPRHVSTTQLWYIILMAVGGYLIWVFLQTLPLLKNHRNRALVLIILIGLSFNFRYSLLPMTSRDPSMPITQEYHDDLSHLHAFMLSNADEQDVLISSRIYGRYVEWMDEPVFQAMYDFQVQTTEADILSIVDQYESGWIIIDNVRIERAVFSPEKAFQENDRIEYVGLFDGEHVWRWRAR